MQQILLIVNDGPYGSEKMFNALRLAINLKEQHEERITLNVFMLSDAVTAALAHHQRSEGYNIQQMLEIMLAQGTEIRLCKTCADDRGISAQPLIEGIQIGTLNELSQWTVDADKVLVF